MVGYLAGSPHKLPGRVHRQWLLVPTGEQMLDPQPSSGVQEAEQPSRRTQGPLFAAAIAQSLQKRPPLLQNDWQKVHLTVPAS